MVAALEHPELFADKVNWVIIRENGILPVSKKTKSPFPDVTTSSKCFHQAESNLLMVHTSYGFDPDAYKLMEESGYDSSKPPSSRHVINAKLHRLNDT